MNEHISDLRWDRWLSGELTREHHQALEAHCVTCAACAARRQVLQNEHAAFALRPVPPELRPQDAATKRGGGAFRTWAWALGLVGVAAAALVFMIGGLGKGEMESTAAVRAKGQGAPTLALFAKHGKTLRMVDDKTLLRPGDVLQAAYSSSIPGFGAVLSRDGAGKVSVYVPSDEASMVRLTAGTEMSFPQSTVLDEVLGAEVVVVVFCAEAHPLAPWRALVQGAEAGLSQMADRSAAEGRPRLEVPGCTTKMFRFQKVAL